MTRVVRLAPVEDVSLPFGCDWAYDWDARCVRDDTARLPIGGDVDKAWRAALRFSMVGLEPWFGVQRAVLGLHHDGTCVGLRGADRRCESRAFAVEAHAILDPDWAHEREVAYDPRPVAVAAVEGRREGWVLFDVTELVAAWVSGDSEAAGILLRLAPEQERFRGSGPKPSSSRAPDPSKRPWLELVLVVPEDG